ncbi:MAG: GNAT family N-acetyltransferase [Xanthobacteraceae bacterium]|nr:GNAT family N-acetyltransferase [Xanthobacteraceae bacterium]MCW5679222.1 GNAT family N-acetyltransferase [Xanthobacteraceae bacterium]
MPVELALEFFASLESLPELAAGFESLRRSAKPDRAAGEAEVFSGADALDAVEAGWRAIEREGALSTPFQSFAVAAASLPAHLAHGHEPQIIVVREHGETRAILPLVLTSMAGARVLRFFGDPLIQYGDAVLSRAGTEAHLMTALLAAEKLGADAALLRKVRNDAKISRVLSRRAQVSRVEEAPFVDLRRDVSLSSRDARELRRYRRRLAEQGEVKLHITRGSDALSCVQTGLELKREWLASKGFTSSVIGDEAWERVLTSLVTENANLLACARLEAGGRLAAIEVAITHGKRWHAFLGAIDPAFAKCGPGQVQMADTIAHARANGFAAYDLLAPADAFKRVIATGAISVRDYALPFSLPGQLAVRAFRFAPQAKSLLGKLPAPVRSAAQTLLRLR